MKWSHWVLCLALLTAILWRVHQLTTWQLPSGWQSRPVTLNVMVHSSPRYSFGRLLFIAQLMVPGRPLVRLSWLHPSYHPRVGDVWRVALVLSPLTKVRHWHDFNMAMWLFAQGIRAVGKVQTSEPKWLVHQSWHPIERLRLKLRAEIASLTISRISKGMLLAFTTGSHDMVPYHAWTVFQKTGTNHLIAIAGLHLGLVMSMSLLVWRYVLACMPIIYLWWPRQSISWGLSLIVSWLYAATADFTLPTIRAVIMLTVMVLMQVCHRILPWRVKWCAALVTLLIINPLVILTASFWLSFISVLLIIQVCVGRLAGLPHWQQWCRIQFVLCIGLAPLTAYFFHQVSLIGFLANAIAVPWVLLLVLPLCLLAIITVSVSRFISTVLLKVAGLTTLPLWKLLSLLAALNFSALPIEHMTSWQLISAMLGVCLLCTPVFRRYRWLGLVYFLPFVSLL